MCTNTLKHLDKYKSLVTCSNYNTFHFKLFLLHKRLQKHNNNNNNVQAITFFKINVSFT